MQVSNFSAASTFSYNESITEVPTSRKGLESLTHAQLVAVAMTQQKVLCKERFSRDDFSANCHETQGKTEKVFTSTIGDENAKKVVDFHERQEKLEEDLKAFSETFLKLSFPKKQKQRERIESLRKEFESYKLEAKNLIDCSKGIRNLTVVEESAYEAEDKLLRFMHELPVRMQLTETKFMAFENRADITSKMKKLEIAIQKSQKALVELMKTDNHNFKKIDKNTVADLFEERKVRVTGYENDIQPLVKELEAEIQKLSDKQGKSQHLNTIILNSKTQEKECRAKVSADLSAAKKEAQNNLNELNGALNSLKTAVISNADEINNYLSGIERGSFKTSMFPTLLGGTTTKEFVTL